MNLTTTQKLAVEAVRKMADHEILNLIGDKVAAPAPAVAAAPAAVVAAPAAPKPKAKTKAKTNGAKLAPAEREANLVKLADALKLSAGVAVSDVAKMFGCSTGVAAGMLSTLIARGAAAMGGERRFARYSDTKAKAEAASQAARTAVN